MSSVFADSAYWIALLHRRDRWHEQALAVSRTLISTRAEINLCLFLGKTSGDQVFSVP
jgi:hypothetical protein